MVSSEDFVIVVEVSLDVEIENFVFSFVNLNGVEMFEFFILLSLLELVFILKINVEDVLIVNVGFEVKINIK